MPSSVHDLVTQGSTVFVRNPYALNEVLEKHWSKSSERPEWVPARVEAVSADRQAARVVTLWDPAKVLADVPVAALLPADAAAVTGSGHESRQRRGELARVAPLNEASLLFDLRARFVADAPSTVTRVAPRVLLALNPGRAPRDARRGPLFSAPTCASTGARRPRSPTRPARGRTRARRTSTSSRRPRTPRSSTSTPRRRSCRKESGSGKSEAAKALLEYFCRAHARRRVLGLGRLRPAATRSREAAAFE